MATSQSHQYSVAMGNTSNLLKWLAITILFTLASCQSAQTADRGGFFSSEKPAASSVSLKSVINNSRDNIEDIKRDADSIVKQSAEAQMQLSPVYDLVATEQKLPIDNALDAFKEIDAKADNILESTRDIERETGKLQDLASQVDKLENKLLQLNSAVEATKVKALEKLYGYITMFWVIGFSLIAIGGAVAFFLNKMYGASIALLGILMIGFASAAQYYMEQIALVGAILVIVGFIGGIGFICWELLKGKKTDQAMREIIEMIEILRETMTQDERERIFGATGLASRIQSDFTKKIVAEIKQRNGFQKLKEVKEEAARISNG